MHNPKYGQHTEIMNNKFESGGTELLQVTNNHKNKDDQENFVQYFKNPWLMFF